MQLPKLGWSFGVLAFVGAAVLSVVVNRWSEEPFQRIRVANAVTDSSDGNAEIPARRDFVGHATAASWSTDSARPGHLGPVDEGPGQNRAVVQTSGSWSASTPSLGLQEVQRASLASGDETTISQPGRTTWEHSSPSPPPQSLPKTYPRATNAWQQAGETRPVPLPATDETSDAFGQRRDDAQVSALAASSVETETETKPAALDESWPPFPNGQLPRQARSGQSERMSRAADPPVSGGDATLPVPSQGDDAPQARRDETGSVSPLPEPGTFTASDPRRMRSLSGVAVQASPSPADMVRGRAEPGALQEDKKDSVGDLHGSAAVGDSVQRHAVHMTRADESLWTICLAYYGRGSYFRAFYEHNRQRIGRPDQLEANLQLDVPTIAELRQWYPTLCPAP